MYKVKVSPAALRPKIPAISAGIPSIEPAMKIDHLKNHAKDSGVDIASLSSSCSNLSAEVEHTVSNILAIAAEKANAEMLERLSAATEGLGVDIASVSSSCSDISNLSAEVEHTVSKILAIAAEKANAEVFGTISAAAEGLGVNPDDTIGNDHAAKKQPDVSTEVIRGVTYFRDILRSETQRLRGFCNTWNSVAKNTPLLSEEIHGLIRSAVGKTKLLLAQRFHQFGGLIDDCQYKRGYKETTANDLAGFWDMVQFQIDDVSATFDHLTRLFKKELEVMDTSSSAIDAAKCYPIPAPMINKRRTIGHKMNDFVAGLRDRMAKFRRTRVAPTAPVPIPTSSPASQSRKPMKFFKNKVVPL